MSEALPTETPTIGSREYFIQELLAFRGLLGDKKAWKRDNLEGPAKALFSIWIEMKDGTESDASLMRATLFEYAIRMRCMEKLRKEPT